MDQRIEDIMKRGEQLTEDINVMKKRLFSNVDYQQPRDAFFSVVCKTGEYVKPAKDEVLRHRSRKDRRSTRLQLRRDKLIAQEIDSENKENMCNSKHFFQSDSMSRRRRRRVVEFQKGTCSCDNKDRSERSSQFDRFLVDVPLTGHRSQCLSRKRDDSADATLMCSANSGEVGRRRVPEGRAVDDTSVWSVVTHDDNRRSPSTTAQPLVSAAVSPLLEPELSRICSSSPTEQRELREQTSSGDLTGAFHSTFSYPLHSTLLSAAVDNVDVSSVSDTIAEGNVASHDVALPVASKSDVTQDVEYVRQKDFSTSDFRFDHVVNSNNDRVKTQSSEDNMKSVISRLSCYTEAGKYYELAGRTNRRSMYFPPLFTTVDSSTSSDVAAAAADVNTPLRQQDSDNDDDVRSAQDREYSQTRDVDTSVEAVRGSPCDSSHDLSSRLLLDVGSRPTPSCRQCCYDAAASSRPVYRSTYRQEGYCVSANSASKSGGRGTSRMLRETGRCDLRHTFNESRLVQDVKYQSLTVHGLFTISPSHRGCHSRCTRVYQSQRQCRRRPCRSRGRRGVERINVVDRRQLLTAAPPSESDNKRSVRYFDPVRKRTLVNRLKQFSGCFCDAGCGRRMRTLANV